MSFNSSLFIFLFFPLSVIGFWIVSRFHNALISKAYLSAISLGFIMCYSTFSLFYVLATVFLLCVFSIIHRQYNISPKLWICLFAVCLLFYKYIAPRMPVEHKLLAPLGISFITFEAISYLVDVWKGKASAGSPLDILLFISFFPKVVSGPIVLWRDFQKQIEAPKWSHNSVISGLELIIIGLFQKTVFADTLAVAVNSVYDNIPNNGSLVLLLTILAYDLQLYFDFLGYSNIALGLSQMMGYSFKQNFNSPYQSKSVTDFWRRWHISLGTWFREYVYFPLGGSREGNVYLNLMIVFLLTGIWHGNTSTFLFWGALHGLFVVLERKTGFHNSVLTFLIVSFGWMIFRANSFLTVADYIRGVLVWKNTFIHSVYSNRQLLFILIGMTACLLPARFKEKIFNCFSNLYVAKYAVLLLCFILSLLYAVNNGYSPFLYFRY